MMMGPFDFDPEKIAEEQKRFEEENAGKRAFASAMQAMANVPSMGEIVLGRQGSRVDFVGDVDKSIKEKNPWEKRKQLLEQYRAKREFEKGKREDEDMAKVEDPSHPLNQARRQAARSVFPQLEEQLDKLQGRDLDKFVSDPVLKEWVELRKAQISAGKRDETADLNRQMAKMRFDEVHQNAVDRKIDKLQDKLTPFQEQAIALEQIDNELGFNVDDYDPKTGKVRKVIDGKEVDEDLDMPGVSVPGLGRVSFYNQKARNLHDTMAGIFNKELKTRSGSAVTSPELARLRSEFSQGKFNTEEELLAALKRYKAAAASAMQQVELGTNPEALAEYENRGAITSKRLQNKPNQQTAQTKKIINGTEYVKVQGGWMPAKDVAR